MNFEKNMTSEHRKKIDAVVDKMLLQTFDYIKLIDSEMKQNTIDDTDVYDDKFDENKEYNITKDQLDAMDKEEIIKLFLEKQSKLIKCQKQLLKYFGLTSELVRTIGGVI